MAGMNRTLSGEVASQVGKTVTIQGWLHKKRLLGGLTFIVIRDRSGLVQAVVKDDKEVEKLRGLQNGTVMTVTGKVIDEPRAPSNAEIHDPKIEIISAVGEEPPIEVDKPLSHKSENLDTLLDYRPIGFRSTQERTHF